MSLADMGLLADIDASFNQVRSSSLVEEAFERWQEESSTFRLFPNVEAIISFLRTPEQRKYKKKKKNTILSLLCTRSRKGDNEARLLLIWLFLPGLWAVRDRLAEHEFLDSDELEAELVAGFWKAVGRIRRGSPKVSGQLLNAARNAALMAARGIVKYDRHRANISADVEFHNWNKSLPVVTPEPTEEAEAAGVISNFEARLIEATRLDSVSLSEFASWVGKSRNAMTLRRWRAEVQLLNWLSTRAHSEGISITDEIKSPLLRPCIGAGIAERSHKDGNGATRAKGEEAPSSPALQSGPFGNTESPEGI